MIFAIKETLT